MFQILQSCNLGELCIAELSVPVYKSGGIMMQISVFFINSGTKQKLVDFEHNLICKALAIPNQVS
jgi:hypothetical protein